MCRVRRYAGQRNNDKLITFWEVAGDVLLTSQPLPVYWRLRNGETPYQIRGFSLAAVVVICHLINMYANHGVIVTSCVCEWKVCICVCVYISVNAIQSKRVTFSCPPRGTIVRGGDVHLSISHWDSAGEDHTYLLIHILRRANKNNLLFNLFQSSFSLSLYLFTYFLFWFSICFESGTFPIQPTRLYNYYNRGKK